MHMVGHIAQAGDIAQAGSHYHDHNTDGIGSCYYLNNYTCPDHVHGN